MDNNNGNIDNSGRSVDYADPAMWRLTVWLGASSMRAWLRNIADPGAPVRVLASASWTPQHGETLRHIENAVYDNPAILDDYSADIIVESDRALWMPKEMADDEETAAELYKIVFPAVDEDDVFSDFEGETVCVYHLADGLGAFIRRTFPGARVTSQLTRLFRRFRLQPNESTAVYADLRGNKVDIIILKDATLLHASTHNARSTREAQYHILNCMRAAEVNSQKAEVFLSGEKEKRAELIKMLREGLPMVRNTMLPRFDMPSDMPTAAMLCVSQAVRKP